MPGERDPFRYGWRYLRVPPPDGPETEARVKPESRIHELEAALQRLAQGF
jgi:hypothetical protein